MKFAASLVFVIVTLAIVSAFDVDFLPEVCKYLVIKKGRKYNSNATNVLCKLFGQLFVCLAVCLVLFILRFLLNCRKTL